MRVLHVLPSLDQMYGGPIRAVVDLSVYSQKLGLTSEILGLGNCNISDCQLPSDQIHSVSLDIPRSYGYSKELAPWLTNNIHRYDGVVIHGLWLYPNWATYQSCQQAKIPYACFPHGMLDPWPVKGQGLLKRYKKTAYWLARERKIIENAESIFFTTKRERIVAGFTFHLPLQQRIVVPYGVADTGKVIAEPARSELIIPTKRKAALFLGRVHPKKNVHFLIEAWLKAKLPDHWELIIAGPCEPRYLRQLKSLIRSSRAEQSVRFVGPVSGIDKAYLLQNCRWFLLPSKQENFGVAVLEAISNGCPAAISDQVYLADELHDETEVLPLTQESWVKFLQERMVNEKWHDYLQQKDSEITRPRFSMESIARSWTKTLINVFTRNSYPDLEFNVSPELNLQSTAAHNGL